MFSARRVVGSMSLPIYIYDCNILGLTNNLAYNKEKAHSHHLNFLFKPELKVNLISLLSVGIISFLKKNSRK